MINSTWKKKHERFPCMNIKNPILNKKTNMNGLFAQKIHRKILN
jgi:hypothetical protein